ncbi:hypothetical protein UFOVP75_123 [uncultured Caudovirales phage]|uniref:Uncharacterized protein n=1 Tax=uncultured Caudovirales phage TaxID=2100421 RepID=A0A6J5KZ06_9CAUD|nr:hypothetical protein UFOVP75_123 [uncultured Caudovirales phage]
MSELVTSSKSELVVPAGNPEKPVLKMAVDYIRRAESRIGEIASMTPLKAPELLATFNQAWMDATRFATMLEAQKVEAQRNVDKVRSVILIDKIPGILLAKNLATPKSPMGSEDVRNAIIDVDVDYNAAIDRYNTIVCYLDLMKGKAKGLEMAYTSVKRILGEHSFNYKPNYGDRSDPTASEAGQTSGFGNYDRSR